MSSAPPTNLPPPHCETTDCRQREASDRSSWKKSKFVGTFFSYLRSLRVEVAPVLLTPPALDFHVRSPLRPHCRAQPRPAAGRIDPDSLELFTASWLPGAPEVPCTRSWKSVEHQVEALVPTWSVESEGRRTCARRTDPCTQNAQPQSFCTSLVCCLFRLQEELVYLYTQTHPHKTLSHSCALNWCSRVITWRAEDMRGNTWPLKSQSAFKGPEGTQREVVVVVCVCGERVTPTRNQTRMHLTYEQCSDLPQREELR